MGMSGSRVSGTPRDVDTARRGKMMWTHVKNGSTFSSVARVLYMLRSHERDRDRLRWSRRLGVTPWFPETVEESVVGKNQSQKNKPGCERI